MKFRQRRYAGQFAERERLREMALDVVAQAPAGRDRQTALERRIRAAHALCAQQQTQHLMRGFIGAQQAVGVLPVFIGERLTQARDAGVFEIGAIGERQFARLAIEFLHGALREVFRQEVQMHEMHVAAHPPARFVLAGQRAEPRRRAVAPGHFLTLGAIAAIQIARQRVMAGPVVDGLGFLGVARPDGDGEPVAEPREAFQIRVGAAQRVTDRLKAERRFGGFDRGGGRSGVHGTSGMHSMTG